MACSNDPELCLIIAGYRGPVPGVQIGAVNATFNSIRHIASYCYYLGPWMEEPPSTQYHADDLQTPNNDTAEDPENSTKAKSGWSLLSTSVERRDLLANALAGLADSAGMICKGHNQQIQDGAYLRRLRREEVS
ncbi:hypothetical protein ACHAPJ_004731 [Fusarium lateritium]